VDKTRASFAPLVNALREERARATPQGSEARSTGRPDLTLASVTVQ